MWRAETNIVLCALLSSRGGGPDDMWRQIMVIPHTFSPFRHSHVWWHAETNIVFCTLLSSRGSGPDDMQRQIMVIPHTFLPFRHSRVQWHAETNVVFCAFCHPKAADPMTCGDKLWSFRTPFRYSDTVVSDGTQRLMSSSTPLVIQRRRARWHAGTIWSRTFHLLSSRGGGPDDMRKPFGPPHFYFCHPEAVGPMTGRDKLRSSARFGYL